MSSHQSEVGYEGSCNEAVQPDTMNSQKFEMTCHETVQPDTRNNQKLVKPASILDEAARDISLEAVPEQGAICRNLRGGISWLLIGGRV